jgi:hypothetical protein
MFDRERAMRRLDRLDRKIGSLEHEFVHGWCDDDELDVMSSRLSERRRERDALLQTFPEVKYWPRTAAENKEAPA